MGQLTDELQEEGPKDGMGQVSKWGFVPGDDNTTDLDLERNGRVSSSEVEVSSKLYGAARKPVG